LTHRDHASAVAFITGHEDPAKSQNLDYAAIARFPGTIVVYMGLHRLQSIATSLIEAGKSAQTPTCVISRATLPVQKTVIGPLNQIADLANNAGLHAPSLLVIGDCVNMRDRVRWFEDRPLFGQVIGITRPDGQADETALRAVELGAQPVFIPTIEIAPPDDWGPVDSIIERIEAFDWIVFTSVNGVRNLLDRILQQGRDMRALGKAKLAAIGPATADAIQRYSLKADLIPTEYRAESLAEVLRPHAVGKRVLWARASRGRDVLRSELQACCAELTEVVVYQNRDVEHLPSPLVQQIERGDLDWITLSSPSIARSLVRLLTPQARSQLGSKTKLASISPVTTSAATESGLAVTVEAATYTWDGLFQAIMDYQRGQSIPQ
jgi:uroporphyrinogen III methyltransferase/synthase